MSKPKFDYSFLFLLGLEDNSVHATEDPVVQLDTFGSPQRACESARFGGKYTMTIAKIVGDTISSLTMNTFIWSAKSYSELGT